MTTGLPGVLDLKMRAPSALGVGWADTVLDGTAGVPWLWWAVTLVLIVGLLLLGLKLFGLLPE